MSQLQSAHAQEREDLQRQIAAMRSSMVPAGMSSQLQQLPSSSASSAVGGAATGAAKGRGRGRAPSSSLSSNLLHFGGSAAAGANAHADGDKENAGVNTINSKKGASTDSHSGSGSAALGLGIGGRTMQRALSVASMIREAAVTAKTAVLTAPPPSSASYAAAGVAHPAHPWAAAVIVPPAASASLIDVAAHAAFSGDDATGVVEEARAGEPDGTAEGFVAEGDGDVRPATDADFYAGHHEEMAAPSTVADDRDAMIASLLHQLTSLQRALIDSEARAGIAATAAGTAASAAASSATAAEAAAGMMLMMTTPAADGSSQSFGVDGGQQGVADDVAVEGVAPHLHPHHLDQQEASAPSPSPSPSSSTLQSLRSRLLQYESYLYACGQGDVVDQVTGGRGIDIAAAWGLGSATAVDAAGVDGEVLPVHEQQQLQQDEEAPAPASPLPTHTMGRQYLDEQQVQKGSPSPYTLSLLPPSPGTLADVRLSPLQQQRILLQLGATGAHGSSRSGSPAVNIPAASATLPPAAAAAASTWSSAAASVLAPGLLATLTAATSTASAASGFAVTSAGRNTGMLGTAPSAAASSPNQQGASHHASLFASIRAAIHGHSAATAGSPGPATGGAASINEPEQTPAADGDAVSTASAAAVADASSAVQSLESEVAYLQQQLDDAWTTIAALQDHNLALQAGGSRLLAERLHWDGIVTRLQRDIEATRDLNRKLVDSQQRGGVALQNLATAHAALVAGVGKQVKKLQSALASSSSSSATVAGASGKGGVVTMQVSKLASSVEALQKLLAVAQGATSGEALFSTQQPLQQGVVHSDTLDVQAPPSPAAAAATSTSIPAKVDAACSPMPQPQPQQQLHSATPAATRRSMASALTSRTAASSIAYTSPGGLSVASARTPEESLRQMMMMATGGGSAHHHDGDAGARTIDILLATARTQAPVPPAATGSEHTAADNGVVIGTSSHLDALVACNPLLSHSLLSTFTSLEGMPVDAAAARLLPFFGPRPAGMLPSTVCATDIDCGDMPMPASPAAGLGLDSSAPLMMTMSAGQHYQQQQAYTPASFALSASLGGASQSHSQSPLSLLESSIGAINGGDCAASLAAATVNAVVAGAGLQMMMAAGADAAVSAPASSSASAAALHLPSLASGAGTGFGTMMRSPPGLRPVHRFLSPVLLQAAMGVTAAANTTFNGGEAAAAQNGGASDVFRSPRPRAFAVTATPSGAAAAGHTGQGGVGFLSPSYAGAAAPSARQHLFSPVNAGATLAQNSGSNSTADVSQQQQQQQTVHHADTAVSIARLTSFAAQRAAWMAMAAAMIPLPATPAPAPAPGALAVQIGAVTDGVEITATSMAETTTAATFRQPSWQQGTVTAAATTTAAARPQLLSPAPALRGGMRWPGMTTTAIAPMMPMSNADVAAATWSLPSTATHAAAFTASSASAVAADEQQVDAMVAAVAMETAEGAGNEAEVDDWGIPLSAAMAAVHDNDAPAPSSPPSASAIGATIAASSQKSAVLSPFTDDASDADLEADDEQGDGTEGGDGEADAEVVGDSGTSDFTGSPAAHGSLQQHAQAIAIDDHEWCELEEGEIPSASSSAAAHSVSALMVSASAPAPVAAAAPSLAAALTGTSHAHATNGNAATSLRRTSSVRSSRGYGYGYPLASVDSNTNGISSSGPASAAAAGVGKGASGRSMAAAAARAAVIAGHAAGLHAAAAARGRSASNTALNALNNNTATLRYGHISAGISGSSSILGKGPVPPSSFTLAKSTRRRATNTSSAAAIVSTAKSPAARAHASTAAAPVPASLLSFSPAPPSSSSSAAAAASYRHHQHAMRVSPITAHTLRAMKRRGLAGTGSSMTTTLTTSGLQPIASPGSGSSSGTVMSFDAGPGSGATGASIAASAMGMVIASSSAAAVAVVASPRQSFAPGAVVKR